MLAPAKAAVQALVSSGREYAIGAGTTETNPYKPPRRHDLPRLIWRLLWNRVCLASLGTAVIFHLIVAILAKGSIEGYWSTILLGLLAVGELVSWTMFGVGGIGWIICRRTLSGSNPDQQSEPDA